VNFQLATYVNSSSINSSPFRAYTAIGFSDDRQMGNDSVAMCRTSIYPPTMAVETYYNDNNYNSDVLSPIIRTIGILNYTVSISNSFLLCNFTRVKSIANYANYFNISNPYYILVAYGDTNSLGNFFVYI